MIFPWGMTHLAMEPSVHLLEITCLWHNVTIVHLPYFPHESRATTWARCMAHLERLFGNIDPQFRMNLQIAVCNVAGLYTAATVLLGHTGHLLAYATDPVWTRNDPQEAAAALHLFMDAQRKSFWRLGCHTFGLPHGCSQDSVEWNMHLRIVPKAIDVRLTQKCVAVVPKNLRASSEQHMLELANSAGAKLLETRQDSCPVGMVTTAACLLTTADDSLQNFARATVYGEHRGGAICEISASMMTSHLPEPQAHHALMRVMMALGSPL